MPAYRRWQRLLSVAIGLLMVIFSASRIALIVNTSGSGLAHAINVSNTAGIFMLVAMGLAGAF